MNYDIAVLVNSLSTQGQPKPGGSIICDIELDNNRG